MKVLFYNPAPPQRRFVPFEAIKGSAFFRRSNYEAMRLSHLADGYEFYYYDEQIEEKPNFSPDLLIVNIPINLARYISTTVKEQWGNEITTICYGVYATIFPEEVKKFSKAVVIGDIVSVWKRILADFRNRQLSEIYEADKIDHFNVDRSIETKYGLTMVLSQLRTSFGCQCDVSQKDFCYENVLYKSYKEWGIEGVVSEVARINRKVIFVLDDDFLFNRDYAMNILERCWRYKKMWIFQTKSSIFNDPKILPRLRDDGVRIIYLKEDWLGRDLVKRIDKKEFVKEKEHQISLIHNYRMAVGCKIRLGYEDEDHSFYRRLLKFLINIKVDLLEVAVQTPVPKSLTYQEYEKDGKIAKDTTLFDQWMPVVRLSGVKPQSLYSWMEWLRDRFYSWDSILLRNILISPKLGFYNTAFFYLIPNLSYRNNFLEKVGHPP